VLLFGLIAVGGAVAMGIAARAGLQKQQTVKAGAQPVQVLQTAWL
jgi:hypothetical protein